jgi:DNA-binding NarL/FixJ family response regulator
MSLRAGGQVRNSGRLRLLLADDHSDVLEETRSLLSREFDVVGTVSDGLSLIKAAEELLPDAVVTDIRMPRLDGIEAARRILRDQLCTTVIALSVYRDRQIVEMALAAGVRGYVLKQTAGEELAGAIRSALNGETFISPEIDLTNRV